MADDARREAFRGRRAEAHGKVGVLRRLAQAEEALTAANKRGLELDGAVIELQAVLVEVLRLLPRSPGMGHARGEWAKRLGPLWPKDV